YNDTSGLAPGQTYVLSMDGDTDVITVNGGSKMQGGQSPVTNGTGSAVQLNALPTVSAVTSPNVTQANHGASNYSFSVAYADSDGSIEPSTIDVNDIRVWKGATELTVTNVTWADALTRATYAISPPGGSWDEADNGE